MRLICDIKQFGTGNDLIVPIGDVQDLSYLDVYIHTCNTL